MEVAYYKKKWKDLTFFNRFTLKSKKRLFSTIHIGAKPALKGTCDSAFERGNCVLSVVMNKF